MPARISGRAHSSFRVVLIGGCRGVERHLQGQRGWDIVSLAESLQSVVGLWPTRNWLHKFGKNPSPTPPYSTIMA